MPETTKIIAAIETVWDALRERHQELPRVVAGIDTRGKKHDLDYSPATVTGEHVPPRLEVPLECARDGARCVVEHLLHVATHALCHGRGVADTNNRGRRHNGKFAAMARELGCRWPDDQRPDPVRGYSPVPVTEEMWEEMAAYVTALDRVLSRPEVVRKLEEATPAKGGSGSRLTLECECGRTFQIGPRVAAMGPIICGVCHKHFKVR